MILGIGTDLVELKRIEKVGTKRLADKILTLEEKKLLDGKKKKNEFLAGRFAAKEAISKALGSGIGKLVGFRDIQILADEKGAPVAKLSDSVWKALGTNTGNVYLSISHTEEYAVAFAVVERV